MNIIINQQTTSPNFNGKLTQSCIKLDKKQFGKVAKLYHKVSGSLPSLEIRGEKIKRDDGTFYDVVNITSGKINELSDNCFWASAKNFQRFFNGEPKNVVSSFLNIARNYFYILNNSKL